MTAFTDSSNSNGTKGAVHGALLTLAALCMTYNAAAWYARRQRHSWVNAGFYAAVIGVEVYQIGRHVASAHPPAHGWPSSPT